MQTFADRARARFAELWPLHAELSSSAEKRVVEWRWSENVSSWDDPRPLGRERDGLSAAPLTVEGSHLRDDDLVGLDADGAVVVVREHHGGGLINRETFLLKRSDAVESARFLPRWQDPEDGTLREAQIEDLLIVRLDQQGRPFETWNVTGRRVGVAETYDYDAAGRLVQIEIPWPAAPEAGLHQACVQTLLPTYGEDGSLLALDQRFEPQLMPDGRVWSRPTG